MGNYTLYNVLLTLQHIAGAVIILVSYNISMYCSWIYQNKPRELCDFNEAPSNDPSFVGTLPTLFQDSNLIFLNQCQNPLIKLNNNFTGEI